MENSMPEILRGAPPCAICGHEVRRRISTHGERSYYRCLSCGVYATFPMPPTEELAAAADRWAKLHHASGEKIASDFSEFIRSASHRPRLRWVEARGPKGRLLDLGCATGGFLETARLGGWVVTGVELAEDSGRYGREERGLDIRTGAFPGVALEQGSFDALTLFEFIEHVPDPLGTLREAHRLLKAGGVVALSTPNLSSLTRAVLGAGWDVFNPGGHLHLFSPESIRLLLKLAGFRDMSVVSEECDPIRLLGKLRRPPATTGGKDEAWALRVRQKQLLLGLLRRNAAMRAVRRWVNGILHVFPVGDVLLARARK